MTPLEWALGGILFLVMWCCCSIVSAREHMERLYLKELQERLRCRSDVLKLIEITERPYGYDDSQEYDELVDKYCGELFEEDYEEDDYDDNPY